MATGGFSPSVGRVRRRKLGTAKARHAEMMLRGEERERCQWSLANVEASGSDVRGRRDSWSSRLGDDAENGDEKRIVTINLREGCKGEVQQLSLMT